MKGDRKQKTLFPLISAEEKQWGLDRSQKTRGYGKQLNEDLNPASGVFLIIHNSPHMMQDFNSASQNSSDYISMNSLIFNLLGLICCSLVLCVVLCQSPCLNFPDMFCPPQLSFMCDCITVLNATRLFCHRKYFFFQLPFYKILGKFGGD